jgi:Spy/CpxP family protein refolding chaperone
MTVLMLGAASPVALAQHHGGHHDEHAAPADTAAAMAGTPTGLTAEEAAGLLDGRGMGMATPAEAHGYPGPLHVLELADSLALTPEQRATAEQLRAAMLDEARDLGAQIVASEHALDDVFARGRASAALVEAITAEIGALRGRLRAAHLRAHLAMRDALSPEQIARYAALRGHQGH